MKSHSALAKSLLLLSSACWDVIRSLTCRDSWANLSSMDVSRWMNRVLNFFFLRGVRQKGSRKLFQSLCIRGHPCSQYGLWPWTSLRLKAKTKRERRFSCSLLQFLLLLPFKKLYQINLKVWVHPACFLNTWVVNEIWGIPIGGTRSCFPSRSVASPTCPGVPYWCGKREKSLLYITGHNPSRNPLEWFYF